MYSRNKQKQALMGRMCGRKGFSVALFAVFCSCAFTYLTFYQVTVYAQPPSSHFTLPNLRWFRHPSATNRYSEEKNVVSKDFNLVIKVLAYDRLHSLRRCLRSLAAADYGGDSVSLVVFVDHFKPKARGSTGRRLFFDTGSEDDETDEAEEDILKDDDPVEQNILRSRQMLNFLDKFEWPHGTKEIQYRSQNIGLQGQWIEAWWPSSDHQFALIVEDDMQLSPLYYRYVRSVIANYYYNADNFDPSIFGITLQRPRFVAGKGGHILQVENSTRLFLYQMVGSWGQVLFPKPWKEFRLWLDSQKARDQNPLLDGMTTSGWYRKMGDKIWTPWFVKFIHSRGYFNFHTNFLKERSLSVSHRSKGVNYRQEAGPDSTLITKKGVQDVDLWEMPPLKKLKWYNFCFHQVFRDRLVNSTHGLSRVLPNLQLDGTVLLVGSMNVSEAGLKNWLCRLGSLGTRNYLLLLNDTGMAKEFVRRGHSVMLIQESDQHYVRAIHQVLKLGYNVWFARPERIWLNFPLGGIETGKMDMLAVQDGNDGYETGLFFIRGSDKSMGALARCLGDYRPGDRGVSLGSRLWSASAASKLRVQSLEHVLTTEVNNGTILGQDRALILDRQNDTSLKVAGLWLVDEELACKRVYCK